MKGFPDECGGGTADRRCGRLASHLERTAAELDEPGVGFGFFCGPYDADDSCGGAIEQVGVPGAGAATHGVEPAPLYWHFLDDRGRGSVA